MRSESPQSDALLRDNTPSKRKRSLSDPTVYPFAPHLQESNAGPPITYTEAQLAGARSPRTLVADQFGKLKIQGALSVIHFQGTPDGVNGGAPRRQKKVKVVGLRDRNASGNTVFQFEQSDMSSEEHGSGEEEQVKPLPKHRRLRSPPPSGSKKMEIQETPQVPRALVMSPTPSPSPPSISDPSTESASGKRSASTNRTPPKRQRQIFFDESIYRNSKPSPPQELSKTIKSTETADHTVDEGALDPEDDGTGINGIGYRPTPAEAWRRTQKRKQQLQEWRAREAKEARQKRSERRNRAMAAAGATDALGANGDGMRRTVRFA